jgi:protein TonB
MADRNPRSAPPANPLMKFLPIIVIVVALAIGAFLFFGSKGKAPAPAPTAGQPVPGAVPGAEAPAAPAAPAPVVEMSKEQLLKEAGTAFREKRYVAPAGNNAYEYYLRVLDKEPNNQIAKDALREMFPFATPIVETDINGNNLDEATREIDLLAKADPSNYTLTILRGKLDAKKKQAEKEQAQAAAAAAAAAAKAAAAAQAPAAAAPVASAPPPPAATPAPPKPAAAAPPPPVAEAPAPAAPVGETHAAQLVKSAAPAYPPEAVRAHKDGWVQVEFTVDANGQVTDAKVANADPPRLFNTAALDAVRRWTFKPRMENGKAVEERMSRRIEFKLGGG